MSDDPKSQSSYLRPGRGARLFNAVVGWLTRRGLSVWGSRILEVRGRRSGMVRRTPVNLLTVDGRDYLVAPRGETEWVRNVRAAGGRLSLVLGRRREEWTGTEISGPDVVPVLRAYLRRWKFEVGVFFEGVDADSSDQVLLAAASRHPVFALSRA